MNTAEAVAEDTKEAVGGNVKDLFGDISDEELDEMYEGHGILYSFPKEVQDNIRNLSMWLSDTELKSWFLVLGYLFGLKESYDELVEFYQIARPKME